MLHTIGFHLFALLTKPEAVSAGMDARLAWSIQTGFVRLVCLESLVKHIGHRDA